MADTGKTVALVGLASLGLYLLWPKDAKASTTGGTTPPQPKPPIPVPNVPPNVVIPPITTPVVPISSCDDAIAKLPDVGRNLVKPLLQSGDPQLIRQAAAQLDAFGKMLATPDAPNYSAAAACLYNLADAIEKAKSTPPTGTPAPPVQAGGDYVVQPGDSPSIIAKRFTGDANRYLELLAANSQKPQTNVYFNRTSNSYFNSDRSPAQVIYNLNPSTMCGTWQDAPTTNPNSTVTVCFVGRNFKSLVAGETIHLPSSWSQPTTI